MRLHRFLSFVVMAGLCVPAAAQQKSGGGMTAKQVLARYKTVSGLDAAGRKKIAGITAIRVTRKVARPGRVSVLNVCEAKEPDKVRTETAGGRVTIQTYDLNIEADGVTVDRKMPVRDNPASPIVRCLNEPAKSLTATKVRLAGRAKVSGRSAYHLIAQDAANQWDEYFDAEKFVLLKRAQPGVVYGTVEEWSDFRTVSGLLVPFSKWMETSGVTKDTEQETLETIDFNPAIDESHFAANSTGVLVARPLPETATSVQRPTNESLGSLAAAVRTGNVDQALATVAGVLRGQPAQAQTTTPPQQPPAQQPPAQPPAATTPPTTATVPTGPGTSTTVAVPQVSGGTPAGATVNQAAQGSQAAQQALAGMRATRPVLHGNVISPACSDATSLVRVDETATGYKEANADMRFTVTNLSNEQLYIGRANCRELGYVGPQEYRRCLYGSGQGWAVVVARSKDIFSSPGVYNACGQQFNEIVTEQESKLAQ